MKNNESNQRKVALECFRIVHGSGDGGSERSFNCLNGAVQKGWMKMAAAIITKTLTK